jgi:hypothetical protein
MPRKPKCYGYMPWNREDFNEYYERKCRKCKWNEECGDLTRINGMKMIIEALTQFTPEELLKMMLRDEKNATNNLP